MCVCVCVYVCMYVYVCLHILHIYFIIKRTNVFIKFEFTPLTTAVFNHWDCTLIILSTWRTVHATQLISAQSYCTSLIPVNIIDDTRPHCSTPIPSFSPLHAILVRTLKCGINLVIYSRKLNLGQP